MSPRRLALALLVPLSVVNLMAWQQARAFTRFGAPGERTRAPQLLSPGEKLRVLLQGVRVPRPQNRRSPKDLDLAFEERRFEGAKGLRLAAWFVPVGRSRGTVALFHGHAASKDALLREAEAFHRLGFSALLVDFHGSGGSEGAETSIGFHEAQDVRAALAHLQSRREDPVVLYGVSMGAVAILKAGADAAQAGEGWPVAGVVLEAPFGALTTTVRHRFARMGLPTVVGPELLLFWGGVQQGFNPFVHRPVDYAAAQKVPALLMAGDQDPFVTVDETRAIARSLQGSKRLRLYRGAAHESLLRHSPQDWQSEVASFLDAIVGPG